ncbi:hypothetical protein [Streptomyces wuyuanensis]|uniref:hypothetical protein n=1 Tax=Streptomyces wuyuanensis TaxID=1196353 RepID=UPI00115FA8EF|nr:hypothetical protein [Streptomyces wuyuanensis]
MLSVRYELEDLPEDAPVRVREGRGWVKYELSRGLFVPEHAAALEAATSMVIAGGQWFQLWRGDVVSYYSPEKELVHARVHRGSLVQEGPSRS